MSLPSLEKIVETTENEFFNASQLYPVEDRFNRFGCATGPASRMKLPAIRKQLLEILAELPTNVWLPMTGLIDRIQSIAPDLIVNTSLCQRPLSEWEQRIRKHRDKPIREPGERYQNFVEHSGTDWSTYKETKLTAMTPDIFRREAVEAFHVGGGPRCGAGVVVLACGAGKTMVGIGVMARVAERTWTLTTGTMAVHQWIEELLCYSWSSRGINIRSWFAINSKRVEKWVKNDGV